MKPQRRQSSLWQLPALPGPSRPSAAAERGQAPPPRDPQRGRPPKGAAEELFPHGGRGAWCSAGKGARGLIAYELGFLGAEAHPSPE